MVQVEAVAVILSDSWKHLEPVVCMCTVNKEMLAFMLVCCVCLCVCVEGGWMGG